MVRWLNDGSSNEKLSLQRIGVQLFGLLIDNRADYFKSDITNSLLDMIEFKIRREMEENNSVMLNNNRWELLYFCLICFEKVYDAMLCSSIGKHSIWDTIVKALIHPHPWVQQVASRNISKLVLSISPTTLDSEDESRTIFVRERKGSLYEIARNLCHQLNSSEEDQDENLSINAIKILSWVVRAMNSHPELCYKEEVLVSDLDADKKDNKRDPNLWVFNRLSNIAKNKGNQRRTAVFKCYAAFGTVCSGDLLSKYLPTMLEPLNRALTEGENEENSKKGRRDEEDEYREIIKQVLQLLENCCGTEEFIKALAAVKSQATKKKVKHKQEIDTEAITNPKAAAERKIQKQQASKRRKKRRMEEKMAAKGNFKKRNLGFH